MTTSLTRRSFLAGSSVLGLSALALTGCSSNSTRSSGAASTSSGSLKTLTVMAPYLNTSPPPADNPIGDALEKILGVSLNITWVPNSSYEDKTNVTLAGNQIPDVMVIQNKDSGFVNNAQAGAFWNLTDYLKDYPNLKTTMPQVQEAASVNGVVYGIFRARDLMRTAVILRKDWLKKAGLSVPKTTDDLYEIAKAFTGTGRFTGVSNTAQKTWGLEIPQWPGGFATNSPYDAIETWYGSGNDWKLSGGKLEPAFMTPQWIEALDYERKLVSQGLVNSDFATLNSVNWNQAFLTGQAGIIIDTWSRVDQINTLLEQQYPNTYQEMVAATGNLIGPDGTMHALPTPGYSGFLVIPKSSVKTAAQLKDVLAVLDKMNSKEAQVLMNNGIEGQNFTLKDGLATSMTSSTATGLTTLTQSYAQLGTNVTGQKYYNLAADNAYDQQLADLRQKTMASDAKHVVYNPAAAFVSPEYAQNGAALDTIITTARIKYIAGQDSLSDLKAAIALWKSSGGSQVISQTNDLYEKSKK